MFALLHARLLLVVVLVAMLAALSGCPPQAPTIYIEYASEDGTASQALPAGGRLNITNHVGPITLVGTEEETVNVSWVKVAYIPENATNRQAPGVYLNQIEVRVTRSGNTVNVSGSVPANSASFSGAVELVIEAPADAITDLRVNMGAVTVYGMRGAIDFELDSGGVYLERVTAPEADEDITGETGVGNLHVVLPAASVFTLDARTDIGAIQISDAFPIDTARYNVTGASAAGATGEGGATIQLRTEVGAILIDGY
ncbi:MAG: hypothetical protein KF886_08525 [Candidatus Hydrogenedentes bacterium]|nr:hypothetical protein [Candidatus Hydrogenedentota bacterium]